MVVSVRNPKSLTRAAQGTEADDPTHVQSRRIGWESLSWWCSQGGLATLRVVVEHLSSCPGHNLTDRQAAVVTDGDDLGRKEWRFGVVGEKQEQTSWSTNENRKWGQAKRKQAQVKMADRGHPGGGKQSVATAYTISYISTESLALLGRYLTDGYLGRYLRYLPAQMVGQSLQGLVVFNLSTSTPHQHVSTDESDFSTSRSGVVPASHQGLI